MGLLKRKKAITKKRVYNTLSKDTEEETLGLRDNIPDSDLISPVYYDMSFDSNMNITKNNVTINSVFIEPSVRYLSDPHRIDSIGKTINHQDNEISKNTFSLIRSLDSTLEHLFNARSKYLTKKLIVSTLSNIMGIIKTDFDFLDVEKLQSFDLLQNEKLLLEYFFASRTWLSYRQIVGSLKNEVSYHDMMSKMNNDILLLSVSYLSNTIYDDMVLTFGSSVTPEEFDLIMNALTEPLAKYAVQFNCLLKQLYVEANEIYLPGKQRIDKLLSKDKMVNEVHY